MLFYTLILEYLYIFILCAVFEKRPSSSQGTKFLIIIFLHFPTVHYRILVFVLCVCLQSKWIGTNVNSNMTLNFMQSFIYSITLYEDVDLHWDAIENVSMMQHALGEKTSWSSLYKCMYVNVCVTANNQ